jgi:hypothetical protein
VIDRTHDQLRESALMTGSAQIHRVDGSPKAIPIKPKAIPINPVMR